MKLIKSISAILLGALLATSCQNSENKFPDFDYQTVYFAKQSVGRTIELGRDRQVDNSIDNEHAFMIKAVRGGAYTNTLDRTVDVSVDPSLCDDLYFSDDFGGEKVKPLPADYYTLSSSVITIPKGKIDGGIRIQLTDKFFADPEALKFSYVLPMVMNSASHGDSILSGRPVVANPSRLVASHWSIQPKDYVLYFLRFVNPWHGQYLRRGVDRLTVDGAPAVEIKRGADYIESDEVVSVSTTGLNLCDVTLSTATDGDHRFTYTLRLSFNDKGECTLTSTDPSVSVSGSGRFVVDGEKKAISGEDRDALYLEYTVKGAGWTLTTSDTMVLRNRGIQAVYPTVVIKKS